MSRERKIKLRIPEFLKGIYPQGLSMGEVAKRLGIYCIFLARSTASSWPNVLATEGKMGIPRKIGSAIFYRFKRGVTSV